MTETDMFTRIVEAGQNGIRESPQDLPAPCSRKKMREEPTPEDKAYIPDLPKHLVARLNGETDKALAVFAVLWRESTMKRTLTVSLSTTELHSWGISHDQKARALSTLERLRLIRVQSRSGKNPLVTLCVAVTPWDFQTTKYYPPPRECGR
jgi:hypothetical protein